MIYVVNFLENLFGNITLSRFRTFKCKKFMPSFIINFHHLFRKIRGCYIYYKILLKNGQAVGDLEITKK